MPNYKLVDADQLEQDLTTIADTVRENTGGSNAIEFPQGYKTEINNIGHDYLAKVLNKQITKLINTKITGAVPAAFQQNNTKLTEVDLPEATSIGDYAFNGCLGLTKLNTPKITQLGNAALGKCPFTEITFPLLLTCEGYGSQFNVCKQLKTIVLPVYQGQFKPYMFGTCEKLEAIVLGGNTLCEMTNANCLGSSSIKNGTGYVYVRRTLVDSYKVATNWSTYANQIRAIEDYPEIEALLPTVTFLLEAVNYDTGEKYFEEYKVREGTTWGEWAEANGYTVLESGAIVDDNLFFLVPYGTYDYGAIKASDIIQEGEYQWQM